MVDRGSMHRLPLPTRSNTAHCHCLPAQESLRSILSVGKELHQSSLFCFISPRSPPWSSSAERTGLFSFFTHPPSLDQTRLRTRVLEIPPLLVTFSSIGYPDDRDRVEGIDQQSDQLCSKALVRLTSTDHSTRRLSVGGIPDPINRPALPE